MKVLIISDTHSKEENLKKVLKETADAECMIHLGDSESGEERIRSMTDMPVYMVAGNCDYFTRLPNSAVVKLLGHRILITHGHYHYVSAGIRELIRDAKENRCDVALFGHTHRPLLIQTDETLTVGNPGSLSYPRQEGRRPSYLIMELKEGERAEFEQKYL